MGMKDFVERWATGVLTTVSIGLLATAWSLYRDVQKLDNWKDEVWPREKQILLLEHEQIRARVSMNEDDVKELQQEQREERHQ